MEADAAQDAGKNLAVMADLGKVSRADLTNWRNTRFSVFCVSRGDAPLDLEAPRSVRSN